MNRDLTKRLKCLSHRSGRDNYVPTGSEAAARTAGKVKTQGRDYIVEYGDGVHFLFNV